MILQKLREGEQYLVALDGVEALRPAVALRRSWQTSRAVDARELLDWLEIFELVDLSHHRHQAVELLNVLPNKTLQETLVRVVFQRLRSPGKDFDYFSWQWTAAMFEDLGLDAEAERVALLALAEADPDVKEFLPFIIGAGT